MLRARLGIWEEAEQVFITDGSGKESPPNMPSKALLIADAAPVFVIASARLTASST